MIEITVKNRKTGQTQTFVGESALVMTRVDDDVTVAAEGPEDSESVCEMLREAHDHVRGAEAIPVGYVLH